MFGFGAYSMAEASKAVALFVICGTGYPIVAALGGQSQWRYWRQERSSFPKNRRRAVNVPLQVATRDFRMKAPTRLRVRAGIVTRIPSLPGV